MKTLILFFAFLAIIGKAAGFMAVSLSSGALVVLLPVLACLSLAALPAARFFSDRITL